MDEKQKLLQLRSEINEAIQNLENAVNHLRDYHELFDMKIRNMETAQLKKEIHGREEKAK